MYVVYFIFYIRRIKLLILAIKIREIEMNVPTVMTHLISHKCNTKLQTNKELGQTCH